MEIRDTLGNLPPDHRLYAGCYDCQRSMVLDVGKLIERLGPDCDTIRAMRKVVCRECGRPMQVTRGHAGPKGLGSASGQ